MGKTTKSTVVEAKKTKSKGDPAAAATVDSLAGDIDPLLFDEGFQARKLVVEENNPSLNFGPNGSLCLPPLLFCFVCKLFLIACHSLIFFGCL